MRLIQSIKKANGRCIDLYHQKASAQQRRAHYFSFDAILSARKEAGLTQAEVAQRMGTKAPAVARLENALVTGPLTLAGYAAQVCRSLGQALEVRLT